MSIPFLHCPSVPIDEAQEMAAEVLRELRLLASADFDATSLLTVVLAGNGRLVDRLRQEDLIPLGTRIRTRLNTQTASREELSELLSHALAMRSTCCGWPSRRDFDEQDTALCRESGLRAWLRRRHVEVVDCLELPKEMINRQ